MCTLEDVVIVLSLRGDLSSLKPSLNCDFHIYSLFYMNHIHIEELRPDGEYNNQNLQKVILPGGHIDMHINMVCR